MMTTPHFHLSPVLNDLYASKDLLDLSGPGSSSPPPSSSTSPQPPSTSLFSSATSIAAAAGRRAAAVASAASPQSGHRASFSPESRQDDRQGGAWSTSNKVEVRCVEGYAENLYIGRSDGVVEWWVCGAGADESESFILRHSHSLMPRRPISSLTILPQISTILVLSEGSLHPFSLPNLEPLPSTVTQTMRGVMSVVLNDEELEWTGSDHREGAKREMTVVLVKRKGLGIYRLGARWSSLKDIPLPSPPTCHALTTQYLCATLPHSSNYALIDLSDASLTEVLPVTQINSADLEFNPNPNIVVIPGENEFLVTSYTGVGTMGVFLNGQGDPVRGTMEWPDHPLSLAIESGYIIALLRSHTIIIHSLNDLEKPVQIIPLDPSFKPIRLTYSPYGVSVRDSDRDKRLIMTRMPLLSGKLAPTKSTCERKAPPQQLEPDEDLPVTPAEPSPIEEPPSGSGLTPPASPRFTRQPITPQRSSSLLRASAPVRGPFSTKVSETLVIGQNGVQSLSPSSVVLQLESLCANGKLDDAVVLVDQEKRKGRRGEIDGDRAAHQATLRYMYLYVACRHMLDARFEKAGEYFWKGKIDPRWVVRLYSTFRGKVIGTEEEVEMYEGLRIDLTDTLSIDDIVTSTIKRNYSPHVTPDTEHAPETLELRHALNDASKTMLTEFLRKNRQSRRKGGGSRGTDSRKIDVVIDTTLARVLADGGTTNELLSLLAGTNDVVLSELEPFLDKRPYVLATVMRQQGKLEKVLDILKGIAESEESDPFCQDPIDQIAQLLDTVTDADVFKRYALWLVRHDAGKGVQILVSQNPKTGHKLDETSLYDELNSSNGLAAKTFLEHVVVHRRNPNRSLHQHLLQDLFDAVEAEIQDEGVKYHLEELESEFRSQDSLPFCVFLASTIETTIRTIRLKLLLFLQGSPFYSLSEAETRLSASPQLGYELSVVLGRLGKHRQALDLLAKSVGDAVSAQTYCQTGGEVVPPKVAGMVASWVPELAAWATLGDVGRRKKRDEKEGLQHELVMELLRAYMRDGASTAKQAASLLNAQSVHLDTLAVLSLVPPSWPLNVMSTFTQRSLRRQLHQRASCQVIKSISAGQNMEVAERRLDRLRELPPALREKVEGVDPISEKDREAQGCDEKGGVLDDEEDGPLKMEAAKYGVGGEKTERAISPTPRTGNEDVR